MRLRDVKTTSSPTRPTSTESHDLERDHHRGGMMATQRAPSSSGS